MSEANTNNETVEQSSNAKLLAELEALLFIHGEPLSRKKISEVLGLSQEELGELVLALRRQLESEHRGLALLEEGVNLQLVTKPQFGDMLQRFIEEDLKEDLTPASLETLALVCYLGPVKRFDIDYIRGVNSGFILRNLSLRGLITRDRGSAGAYVYQPSAKLLAFLGVSSQEDLPEFSTYSKLDDMLKEAERDPQEHVIDQ